MASLPGCPWFCRRRLPVRKRSVEGTRRATLPRRTRKEPAAIGALFPDVFCKYPDDVALHGRRSVKHVGSDALNVIAQAHELRLPRKVLGALDAGQFVHRGVTDLAVDRL